MHTAAIWTNVMSCFGWHWIVCLCCCTADVNGLCVWCEISPTRLLGCSLGSAGAGQSVTGLPAALSLPALLRWCWDHTGWDHQGKSETSQEIHHKQELQGAETSHTASGKILKKKKRREHTTVALVDMFLHYHELTQCILIWLNPMYTVLLPEILKPSVNIPNYFYVSQHSPYIWIQHQNATCVWNVLCCGRVFPA